MHIFILGFDQFQGSEQSPFEHFQQLLPPPQQLPPAIDESEKKDSKSLREQLLKPEFRRIQSPEEKVDTVLDGKYVRYWICFINFFSNYSNSRIKISIMLHFLCSNRQRKLFLIPLHYH